MSRADPTLATRRPSLAAAPADVPDRRQARGRRHPRLARRRLTSVARLGGARAQRASAAWVVDHGPAWRQRVGVTHPRGPSQSTLARLFQPLDQEARERQRAAWADQATGAAATPLEGVSREGTVRRGSRQRGGAAAHRRRALHPQQGRVRVTGGDAVAAARTIVGQVARPGRVVTVAAGLAHPPLARAIRARHADDLMPIKEHQPTRLEDLRVLVAAPATVMVVATTTTAHGGRIEDRRRCASPAVVGSSDWPGLQQGRCRERVVIATRTGGVRRERAEAVPALAPTRAGAADLRRLWRGQWSSEIV